ncbi:unnamed protein product [Sphagnum tenellum]
MKANSDVTSRVPTYPNRLEPPSSQRSCNASREFPLERNHRRDEAAATAGRRQDHHGQDQEGWLDPCGREPQPSGCPTSPWLHVLGGGRQRPGWHAEGTLQSGTRRMTRGNGSLWTTPARRGRRRTPRGCRTTTSGGGGGLPL